MDLGREQEQRRESGSRQVEGQKAESLEPQVPGGAREPVALPAPSQPDPSARPATHYSRFDYRLAKDFLKDGSLLWSTESPTAATRFHLLPGGTVWRERESLLESPENGYSLESVEIPKLVEDGPAGVVLALRDRGILPPAVHSDRWFDAAFEGMQPPERLRRLSERLCRAYGIGGTADPAHIANMVARELGLGDGRGQFYTGQEGVPAWRVEGIKEISIGAAVGHLNEILAGAGHGSLAMDVTDFWWRNCHCLDEWRSSVVADGKGAWSVRLEAHQSRDTEETDVVAALNGVSTFDEALRMSNLVGSWLQAQGL